MRLCKAELPGCLKGKFYQHVAAEVSQAMRQGRVAAKIVCMLMFGGGAQAIGLVQLRAA